MKPNILVVDDEQGLRQLLEIVLRKEGYQVSVASSGKEALEKLSTRSSRFCQLPYPHAAHPQRHRAAQGDLEQRRRHGRHSHDSLCLDANGDQRAEAGGLRLRVDEACSPTWDE